MQIFVKTLTGKTITVEVEASDTIGSLKEQIQHKEGIAADEQRTTYGGKELDSTALVSDYDLRAHCTVDLAVRLIGGHCQVPCGIFDDPKLVTDIEEACATIKKALAQMAELSSTMNAQSFNQIARWASTKEEHASKIIELMTEYCLCQRVKPTSDPKSPFKSEDEYTAALQAHHTVMLAAVKCKQSSDPQVGEALASAIAEIGKMYKGKPAAPDNRPVFPEAPDTRNSPTTCSDGCILL
uniref:Ubiquitin-like domain-containing protein n=1 Tax=Strombidinopsis acuminata TaxID=141414 RepID=A0A7S3SLF8_9SPIT|mmetsp:Transcript_97287/g.251687  ORF Transcript_97287/g.251687 Transcript_97287/m.251687 type:complete len:240 (-) Transcript_97287:188-907(-)